MRIVTANELQHWLNTGQIVEKDSRGPKVVCLQDGRFLKIFRSKRPWLARWRPEAKRFAHNAQALGSLGIATPEKIESVWLEPDKGVSACLYYPLNGTPLESLFKQQRPLFDALLADFSAYIYHLHQNGIYFRSLHLGNVLLLPAGGFGLIDFLDLRIKRSPLSQSLVRRNFAHLQGYLKRRNVEGFPWEELIRDYELTNKPSN
ncbi:hypothetical protein SAMN05216372_10937 [Pseudomonas straminea]|uniref:Toluene tolerance protein n=2 Tax=Pseudomonas straminea TaxID=47882 RepID=A0A1I1XXF0_PSEOC|nr:hypothetical protein SAMN05216372_10937 [Pseudomonas straminea]